MAHMTSTPMPRPHRPGIDGLRAVAVLSVIAYHAGVLPGGLVGVDVFFVISGYLITALLAAERERTGRIDFLAFYARRVRRILPAMLAVVGVTVAAAAMLLPALEQRLADQSALAALSFTANFYFERTTGGYFDPHVEQMPLLHLWSLSVEEQFYLLWPVLLLFVRRRAWLVALAACSLGLAELWIAQGSNAAFFQAPARMWELAAGGLLALSPRPRLPAAAPWAGLVLIIASCFVTWTHFPGVAALPAVVGSLLVLGAHDAHAAHGVLASRPMRFVGERSYSLYLWHWPFLAFHHALTPGLPTLADRLLVCGAAALAAFAAYRYVEDPLRRATAPSPRIVAAGVAASLLLAAATALPMARIRVEPADVAAGDYPERTCHYQETDDVFPKCPLPPRGALIWGDSMAYAWSAAMPSAVRLTRDGCRPLLGHAYEPSRRGRLCRAFNDRVLEQARSKDLVVLAGWWTSEPQLARLGATLDALRDVGRVVVIGPSPDLADDAPKCIRLQREAACAVSRAAFDARARIALAGLRALAARHPNVRVVDVTDVFCDARSCPPVRNGVALYWDDHHVSSTAARNAARDFAPLRAALHRGRADGGG